VPRPFPILQRLLLILGGVGVALIAAEQMAPRFAPFSLVDGRFVLINDRHPQQERVAMSDIDGIPVWFYDHPDRPPPNPHKEGTRIVVLGDSVLMPMGVADHDSAPRLLEGLLAQTLDGGAYEVVNLAEGGWDTLQEEALLRRRALALQPDLVVVGLTPNDGQQYVMIDGQLVLSEFINDAEARGGHFLARRSYLWNWIWLAWKAYGVGTNALHAAPQGQSVLASLMRMAEMTHAAGARMAILCLPSLPADRIDATVSCLWSDVVAWSQQTGIPLLDLAPKYAPYPMPLMRIDHIHLTPFGHRVLALAWLRWLVEQHLVPGHAPHALPDFPAIP
jgi:lysophospholipase L1-like esterase